MAMYEEYMCEFKFLEEKLRIYTKRKKKISELHTSDIIYKQILILNIML